MIDLTPAQAAPRIASLLVARESRTGSPDGNLVSCQAEWKAEGMRVSILLDGAGN